MLRIIFWLIACVFERPIPKTEENQLENESKQESVSLEQLTHSQLVLIIKTQMDAVARYVEKMFRNESMPISDTKYSCINGARYGFRTSIVLLWSRTEKSQSAKHLPTTAFWATFESVVNQYMVSCCDNGWKPFPEFATQRIAEAIVDEYWFGPDIGRIGGTVTIE